MYQELLPRALHPHESGQWTLLIAYNAFETGSHTEQRKKLRLKGSFVPRCQVKIARVWFLNSEHMLFCAADVSWSLCVRIHQSYSLNYMQLKHFIMKYYTGVSLYPIGQGCLLLMPIFLQQPYIPITVLSGGKRLTLHCKK